MRKFEVGLAREGGFSSGITEEDFSIKKEIETLKLRSQT